MNVMLLAAGEGTRLRPYTNILPKPAIPFLTVPLAAHALGFLRAVEIDKLVVNTYHLPEKIHELFHRIPHGSKNLHFSDETGEILGSGGGLGKARAHFIGGGDFIMMNADEVILPENSEILREALKAHQKANALATLLVMDHPGVGTQFGGVWTNTSNKVLGFGKNPIPGSQKAWHFVGVQILSDRIFDYIPEAGPSNILYDAVTEGIAKGETVQAFPFTGSWFETGNFKDFLEASEGCFRFLSSNENSYQKTSMLKTLSQFSAIPLQFKIQENAYLVHADTAKIADSKNFQGLVVLGANSTVGPHCRLKNVIVGDNVAVPANTEASDLMFL